MTTGRQIKKPPHKEEVYGGFSLDILLISADGYNSFAIFASVTNDGSDDGDDGNGHDDGDDLPSPSRRNRRSDDGDGTGLRTAGR